MTNKQIATDILKFVGNKGNINSVVHCATRLRFKLKDESKVKIDDLKKHPAVLQVIQGGGQYQVVIGNHVSDVHKELVALTGLTGAVADTPKEKQNFVNTCIDIISAIFTPFLGILAGTGVLKGLLNLSVFLGWISNTSGTYQILYAAADGFLTFLPIALAFTAAKKFKCDPFLAVALAMSLVYPGIVDFTSSNDLNFLGIPVIYGVGYASTVIPIILAVYLQSYVEGFIRKIMPRAFRIFGVAVCTLLIMVPLTYIVIGPLGLIIGSLLGGGVSAIYSFSPIITGLLLGALWQITVIFGMHWGLVPLVISNLGMYGYDVLLPMVIPGVIAQGGASLAVSIKAKNIRLKGLASSGAITSIFGITEPTVYGVTLPLKKPFIAAGIGGAVGGCIVAIFGVKTFAFSASIFIIPNFISTIDGVASNIFAGIAAIVLAFVTAFIFTFILGFDESKVAGDSDNDIKEVVEVGNSPLDEKIISPLTGNVLKLEDIEDEAFSSGAMGKGVAIDPVVGELRSPANGVVTAIFPTNHAVGITTDEGVEVLMHIGMDTVEMEGRGFTAHVETGARVKLGDLLIEFDIKEIRASGKSTVTPIIITNTDKFEDIQILKYGEIAVGETIMLVTK